MTSSPLAATTRGSMLRSAAVGCSGAHVCIQGGGLGPEAAGRPPVGKRRRPAELDVGVAEFSQSRGVAPLDRAEDVEHHARVPLLGRGHDALLSFADVLTGPVHLDSSNSSTASYLTRIRSSTAEGGDSFVATWRRSAAKGASTTANATMRTVRASPRPVRRRLKLRSSASI